MKKILMTIGFALLVVSSHAQILKPVKWNFRSKKVKANRYEVHLTAVIDKTWKIYSGSTPEGGPSPTVIKFKPNPLVLLGGKIKEVGNMHKIHEPAFGVDVWYFKGKVDFVQIVKIKNPSLPTPSLPKEAKGVILQGTVEFMACDESQCLPPEEVEFSVELK